MTDRSDTPADAPDATPAAEAEAAAAGVELADVPGTGAEGRVTKADVVAAEDKPKQEGPDLSYEDQQRQAAAEGVYPPDGAAPQEG